MKSSSSSFTFVPQNGTQYMKKNKSFTVIELLVVIAIIGLISSIVLVNMDLPKQRQKAKIAKTLQFSQSIQSALGSEVVGIWEFDEGSGAIAKDRSGYGNNGTINGAFFVDNTPQKVAGASQGKYALSFDGVNDYVNAGSGASLDVVGGGMTAEFWMYEPTGSPGNGRMIAHGSSGNGNYSFYRQNSGDNSYLVWLVEPGSSSEISTTISKTVWHHIVGTYDGAFMKMYIDGVEKASAAKTGTTGGSQNLIIGGRTPLTPVSEPFYGLLDEVRVYKQALTIGQIQKHYAEGLEKHKNF